MVRVAPGSLEARPMKMEKRFTSVHQSMTFSRRMAIAAGAQTAVGALILGRLGWLAVAENQHYQLLSESNRVQLIIVPPRRGWIVDRNNKPIAINRSDFRVDIIPDQLENPEATLRTLQQLLELSADDVDRVVRELKQAQGYRPIEVAENVPFDKYAAVTLVPHRPMNMRRNGTLYSSHRASRSARKVLKKRWNHAFAVSPAGNASN
jgi:penicillin-binding protein 2